MSLLTRDYDYSLPEELIAQRPLERREASRMMVLHRSEGRIEHRSFADFPGFVRSSSEGDLVVLNNTRVIPARAFSDDGRIELLFLESANWSDASSSPSGSTNDASTGDAAGCSEGHVWKCMVKPGRKMRIGATVSVGGVEGWVREILPAGERIIKFSAPVDLDRFGQMPIPPYLGRSGEALDAGRYQTVFAQSPGAVAAPTAGLHFTPEILARVPHAFLTLHVGAGTFLPVKTERITEHAMHRERFVITEPAARAINAARRIFAVGTTTVRVLESCAGRGEEGVRACEGSTDIFIYPPFEFRMVDALLTNFHLPKSTLLMLVSAFAGREFILRAYEEAIRERYRFYSYGDCMLIL